MYSFLSKQKKKRAGYCNLDEDNLPKFRGKTSIIVRRAKKHCRRRF